MDYWGKAVSDHENILELFYVFVVGVACTALSVCFIGSVIFLWMTSPAPFSQELAQIFPLLPIDHAYFDSAIEDQVLSFVEVDRILCELQRDPGLETSSLDDSTICLLTDYWPFETASINWSGLSRSLLVQSME